MTVKQVIVMRTDLNMRKGKMVAQGAHASMGAILSDSFLSVDGDSSSMEENLRVIKMTPAMKEWLDGSFVKICVGCSSEAQLLEAHEKAKQAGLISCLITDNGTTEFGGVPTNTCLAIGPNESVDIDKITGGMKLL